MTLKEIIIDTATLLSLDGVLSLPEMGGNTQSNQSQNDLSLLKKCVNLTINEIAGDYIPLNFIESVLISDQKIPYTALKKPAQKIKSIKDGQGANCYFKVYPSYIYTDCKGECHIEYSYIPANLEDLNGSVEVNPKATSRLIAYGTAREYCLITSMYEQAKTWDERYKDGLQNIAKASTVLKIPKRLWR